MGSGWLCSLNSATWQKIHKNESYSASMIYNKKIWIQNLDLKGPGPHVLLELWSIIFRKSL